MQAAPIPYRDPLEAFHAFRDKPMSLLLHSSGAHPAARWSYALVSPSKTALSGATLDTLRSWMREAPAAAPMLAGPFLSGAAGVLCYDFAAQLDAAMPQVRSARLPEAAFGYFPHVIVFDNQKREAYAVSRTDLDAARAIAAEMASATPAPREASGDIAPEHDRAVYMREVDWLRGRIRAGDVFQANISRLYAGRLGGGDHPYDLFRRLCAASPSPFCAYMRLDGAAIVSNSPERLASVRREGDTLVATSAPIKGTRPRGADAQSDEAEKQKLRASLKDRAENLMIVDLMRNDFSRICAPGSVHAPKLFELETFTNVHHLVSSVQGRLKPGRDAIDLLEATFPAGSITGAPKIKAMELIQRIESAPREANYGSIFWIDDAGAMDVNVLIRTATCFERAGRWDVEFRVGGGITIDSNAADEAAETEAKAANLIAAIAGPRR